MANLQHEWATYLGKAESEITHVDTANLTGAQSAQFLGISFDDADAMVGVVNPPAPEPPEEG